MGRKTYRKEIVTDEIKEKILPINLKIVNRYLKNFSTKRSEKSCIVKQSDYNIFLCWNYLYNDNKPIYEIKKSELMDFFDFGTTELNWGSSRFNSMHSSLNTLFGYIENFLDEDYPKFKNNMSKIEKPVKQAVREKTVLSEEQVNSLIEHLKENEEDIQQLVCLLLLIGSGVRLSESLRITTDLIDENNLAFGDAFLKTEKKIKTKGFGKNGTLKYRYIYKDLFFPDYQRWLPIREELLQKTGKQNNSILLKKDGDPVTIDIVNYWIKKWEKFLSTDTKTNPKHEQIYLYAHCFRHYLCTLLTKKGISQELIVAIFGWASGDAMFHIYSDISEDEREYKDLDKLKGVF